MNKEIFPQSIRAESENMKQLIVPESECAITFARSGGKGGQNVNKVETKAVLRWNLRKSPSFTDTQKEIMLAYAPLANRMNENGELVLYEQSQRAQAQNKTLVVEKLNRFVNEALAERAERVATKVPRSSREARLEEKRKTGEKKAHREKIRDWE